MLNNYAEQIFNKSSLNLFVLFCNEGKILYLRMLQKIKDAKLTGNLVLVMQLFNFFLMQCSISVLIYCKRQLYNNLRVTQTSDQKDTNLWSF